MNQQKIEPDFKHMAATLDEVIDVVKQDSLQPVVKTFMETLDSKGYRESEILNAITDYFHLKDSEKYHSLINQLERTVKEVRKINGEIVLFS